MEKEEKEVKIQNLIIYFFVCGCIGWILECIYAYIVLGEIVNRGFLYGPICPIYGFGAIIMIGISEGIQKRKTNLFIKFLIFAVIFTVLEYITSLAMELIFHQRWWDYTNELLNINGRVCLMFSLMFGVMGVVFTEWIYKPSRKWIEKIREKIESKTIWDTLKFVTTIWIADTIISILRYLNLLTILR